MKQNFKSVVLKPGKERALINRHPWLFSGAVGKIDDSLVVGDAICIKDHNDHPLALGHWCADDGLVARILSFDTATVFDEGFFTYRFGQAKRLREQLGLPHESTSGYRLIHGEGDGLSGLICDIFADTAHIQLSNPGLRTAIDVLSDFLVHHCRIKNIFFSPAKENSYWLKGHAETVDFSEHGLIFSAAITTGQKTGYFLDQRDNRALVKELAQNRTVLDAFCYSGGFSTYALSGLAKNVTSVDIAQDAIELTKENVKKNHLSQAHHAVVADCFDYLRHIKKDEFDCIILDPPAFAKTAQAVSRAARGYKDINLQAIKSIKENGLIFTFSCSQHIDNDLFKKIIFAAAKDSTREVTILKDLSQPLDHPISIYCPQSSYLKGLLLHVG